MAAKKSKAESKAKAARGGKRAGAGRKTAAVTQARAELIEALNRTICDNLLKLGDNLLKLANGGYERVEEKWETRLPTPRQVGKPEPEPNLVLVERRVTIAEPDRRANEYLVNRVLGLPKQPIEHDFGGLSDAELIARATGLFGRDGAAGPDAADD
jgi:hypothetical protein